MVRYDDLLPPPSEDVAADLLGVYSLACALAGHLIDTFLFGIFTVQIIEYLDGEIKDPLWVKALVTAVSLMACLLTGFNFYVVSNYFVYHFGVHTVFFEVASQSWLALIDCVTMSLCQSFFAYRAYRLCSRNILIPFFVGACILASLGATIAIRIIYGRLNSLLDSLKVQPATVSWIAITLIADGTNTGCILYGLISMSSKSGMEHTNKLITRLIRITLESQSAATVLAIAMLVDAIADPDNMLGIAILTFHSKVYVLGLMYSLNSRKPNSQAHMFTIDDTHPMAFSRTQAATIVVDQETEMHVMTVPPPPRRINRAQHVVHVIEDDEILDETDSKKSLGSGQASSGAALNGSTTKVAEAV